MSDNMEDKLMMLLGVVLAAVLTCLFLIGIGFSFRVIWFMLELGWSLI